jgi:hypothetical protein
MENWQIQRVIPVLPSEGSGADAAYRIEVSYGDERGTIIVEFAEPSSVASGAYAQDVVKPYLAEDEPPQRLLVQPNGSVTVAEGPLSAVRTPRKVFTPAESKRGRRRGNR